MTRHGWTRACLLAIAVAVLPVAVADAGWPLVRQRRSWDKSNVYAPETHEYVVVSPTPAQTPMPLPGCDPSKQPPLWEVRRTTPPAYPWGWFGTRTSQQSMTHTGYYGNYKDQKLMREW